MEPVINAGANRAPETRADAVEAPPPAAAEIFGAVLPLAVRYARLLTGPGVERGLVGPDEAARVWDRHLLNCAVVAELIGESDSVVDLGSGAGLPGIVLAMLRPSAPVTLLEPIARRVSFLAECVSTLGLGNAVVTRGRAQDMAGQLAADVVVSRAVAPMDKLAGLAAGLAKPGGRVLAIKGAGAAEELARAQAALRRLGARDVELIRVGSGKVDPPATVVRFTTGPARNRAGGQVPPGASGHHQGAHAVGRPGRAQVPRGQQRRPNARRTGG